MLFLHMWIKTLHITMLQIVDYYSINYYTVANRLMFIRMRQFQNTFGTLMSFPSDNKDNHLWLEVPLGFSTRIKISFQFSFSFYHSFA